MPTVNIDDGILQADSQVVGWVQGHSSTNCSDYLLTQVMTQRSY